MTSESAIRLPSPAEIAPDVARQLDRDGFVCLQDAVAPEWVERARAYVRRHLAANGDKFFSIIRPADEAGSPFDELVHDPKIVGLLEGVGRIACPQATFDDEVYNVLRVIAGPKGTDGSCEFHYDATVVTMLVPIFMPEGEPHNSGELLTFPNKRPYRGSVLTNLAEKALVQNKWAWDRTEQEARANLSQHMQLLHPGNLYLFWGYRTLHGNLPCAPNSLRTTLLLHHGDPHGGNALLKAVRSGRKVVENWRRTRA
ncbi:hypothetical protein OLX02_01155 [Novosphingobium sp. KCTC 2891]|uniref:hypothetical protein n=1 Tax=Novosphingobium sp. KCTC 2891 TaxID=2989730 RepID=UPI002223A6A1|nr:hypothetical protein [Novosphingobium sp. KCTC 2891]MCW1381420.1 hypothetical protein [Novosphingobium sp. KCTC 2891]